MNSYILSNRPQMIKTAVIGASDISVVTLFESTEKSSLIALEPSLIFQTNL